MFVCFIHHGTPIGSFTESFVKIQPDLAEIRIRKLDWRDGGKKKKRRRGGILLCKGLILGKLQTMKKHVEICKTMFYSGSWICNPGARDGSFKKVHFWLDLHFTVSGTITRATE